MTDNHLQDTSNTNMTDYALQGTSNRTTWSEGTKSRSKPPCMPGQTASASLKWMHSTQHMALSASAETCRTTKWGRPRVQGITVRLTWPQLWRPPASPGLPAGAECVDDPAPASTRPASGECACMHMHPSAVYSPLGCMHQCRHERVADLNWSTGCGALP